MMKYRLVVAAATLLTFGLQNQVHAQLLGTADTFAVLAGTAITNTGLTTISGNIGVGPGTAVTGFPDGIVTNGAIHAGGAITMQAQSDTAVAYNTLAGTAPTQILTGQNLGGMTLFAGVYRFSTSAFLTGTLTLDAQNDPNARFYFQIGSTLITASNSSVVMINTGNSRNAYWQVGSSATLGTNSAFAGRIIALSDITISSGASIMNGSAMARNGAVTMNQNAVSIPVTAAAAAPEPGTLALLGVSVLASLGCAVGRRRRAHCN